MGAPIKHRKKYISHKKRWDKNTIDEELIIVKDYALKNKKEIRRVEFKIGKYKRVAKELNKTKDSQDSKEAKAFIASLKAKGILNDLATSLDEVLDINIRSLLDRRLSTVLYKHKLARSPTQARQFIVHRHVKVNGVVVDSPSFQVSLSDEATIDFKPTSSLSNEDHPERKLAIVNVEEVIVSEEESTENLVSDTEEKEVKV